MENINNELTLINDEENKKDDHDDDLTVIDNDENNAEVMTSLDDEVDEIDVKSEKNQDIDLAEIKIDFGDNNPLFSNSSDDNLSMESDIDLKLDKDTSGEDDLFNFGDIDLSLDFEENPKIGESTELSGRGLDSEVGTVIEDMKDSVNSFSVSEGYQEYNAPQADEDDEIILIDEHNQPISNSDDAGNNTEKDNNENKTDSFADDDDFQIITDENDDTTSFVRPISVSDLNNQFIEEEDDSKTEIDEIDDEIVFVDSNSDEDVNFVRPASINYEEITENNENVTKEKSEVITEENDEIPSNPIPVERPKTVLYDEDGFEIESESSEVEVPEVENLHEYGVSQANEEPETVEYDTDESEYDETYTDETEENDYDESEEVEEDRDVEEESQNKNSFIKKAAIIGIICLIGLGSVGGGLFFYMKKVKQDQMKNIAALNSLNEENTAETDGLTPDEVQSDNENNQENVNPENSENPDNPENHGNPGNPENSENPEQAPENQQKLPEPPAPKSIEEVKTKDMNQAMTDAFSNNAAPIKITKLSWAVAPYIAADNDFKAFLQTSGRAIQTEVKKNLIAVHDNTYAENTKVQIEIKDGAADNITISKSSGSKQIDEIVLQSVKDYMTNAQLPQLSETTVDAIKNANGSYNFKITLSINF